jgi:hypothetical protein
VSIDLTQTGALGAVIQFRRFGDYVPNEFKFLLHALDPNVRGEEKKASAPVDFFLATAEAESPGLKPISFARPIKNGT